MRYFYETFIVFSSIILNSQVFLNYFINRRVWYKTTQLSVDSLSLSFLEISFLGTTIELPQFGENEKERLVDRIRKLLLGQRV